VREELITRNVARLVELPAWEPSVIVPWSPSEALAFLQAAIDDPLYPAFVLLLLYGLRGYSSMACAVRCVGGGADPARRWGSRL